MLLGSGTLDAAVGVYNHDRGLFMPVHDRMARGDVQPLSESATRYAQ